MPSELYRALFDAVSPFDAGVAALEVKDFGRPGPAEARPGRTAAVLVPILDKPEPEILLTVRADTLPQHPGQVSFPGGAVDREDRSAISTALREAEEEIGLDFSQVSPVGFLDRLDTISDYRVLPVVGLIDPMFVWKPNEYEVSEVFTVPMKLAVNYDNYTHHRYERNGRTGVTSSLQWQGHIIWGITAGILLNLGHRLGNWNGTK
ncbi:MAG: CoA pyrophosphatase [Xanthomonadales bacterium]|nr:CoA pyrophosphatase [Xanthomonadales bacterium]